MTNVARFALVCLTGCVSAAAASPEFEVASVKQLDQIVELGRPDLSFVGLSGKIIKIAGNRITVNGTLHTLIAAAYAVKDYQVSGVPSWADALLWAVVAKTPGDAELAQEQVRPMLQALLADRFQLKFHRETKELAVYHLTQVKKTAAFHAAASEETFNWALTPGPPGSGTFKSKATRESIADFVQLTAVSADRPIVDKTGITGFIDYEIDVSQDGVKTVDDQNRAILDAIKQQLGFKLEPARDQAEMLVIDHAGKASEN